MWQARNKTDLIIEVWEKLDCESVGLLEIEAIETVVRDVYGESAVEPPMIVARMLADEGAVLRHSEIMQLHVRRASPTTYDAALEGVFNFYDLHSAARTIRRLEALRQNYRSKGDVKGIRLVRDAGQRAKEMAAEGVSEDPSRSVDREISQWFTIWLQTPELFESWVDLRVRSTEFTAVYGHFERL